MRVETLDAWNGSDLQRSLAAHLRGHRDIASEDVDQMDGLLAQG